MEHAAPGRPTTVARVLQTSITCLAALSAWPMAAAGADGDLHLQDPAAEPAPGRPTMRQMPQNMPLPAPPSSRDLVAGRSEMRRRYRDELAHADTGAGARLAAETLLTAALTETDRSLKWVLLEEARQLGEAAGQADLVSRAVASAAAVYEFDDVDLELRSLKQIPLRGIDAGRAATLASAADNIATRAETDGRPDKAAAAALLASRAWERAGNKAAAALSATRHDSLLPNKARVR
jgi:hypothetical protein